MDYILQTFDLCKSYRNQQVLNKVNMNIAKGDIYGFVGENGSGKTTVIRLITGLIHPSSGKFSLFGVHSDNSEIVSARKRLGAIVETPSIYMNFSAKENLRMQGGILGNVSEQKMQETLALVGLGELWENKKHVDNFSLGMRQRLGIAMALLGDPEFIVLDEPMNGLDPAGIVEIRELILRLNKEKGITFLISSHILTELALVATKYGIISHGQLICEISNQELQNQCEHSVHIQSEEVDALYDLFKDDFSSNKLNKEENGIRIYGDIDFNGIFEKIINAKIKITAINSRKFSIEEFYLATIKGAQNV